MATVRQQDHVPANGRKHAHPWRTRTPSRTPEPCPGAGAQQLLTASDTVLLDFDGPVCRLYSERPARRIADRLREVIRAHGNDAVVTADLAATGNPELLLLAVARTSPGSALLAEMNKLFTDEEVLAADSAEPTPGADGLIRALALSGRHLAVTTNNSPLAVQRYLRRMGLHGHFDGHIHGRTRDPFLLKPHPSSLLRALEGAGDSAHRALMIGDSPADVAAAAEANVAFIGYARNRWKREQLQGAGAVHVVEGLGCLTAAFGEDACECPSAAR